MELFGGICPHRDQTTVDLRSEQTLSFAICGICEIGMRKSQLPEHYHAEAFHRGRPVPIEFFERRARSQWNFILDVVGRRPEIVHDFGAGNGYFLNLARVFGAGTAFSEVDRGLSDKLRAEGHMDRLSLAKVDHHHLSHSLEHVEDFTTLLRSLRGDGSRTVFVEVPNEFKKVMLHGGKKIGDGHVSLFSKKSLRYALSYCGFEVKHIETMSSGYQLCNEDDPYASWIRCLAVPKIA